mgnify:CR=1 FL=1
MTSAALSSAPIPSQPPTATGTAGSARPAPSARGSRSTRTSAAPGFFTSVRVEILKMRRLRVLLVTVLLLVASIAISTMELFSLARRGTLDTPSSQPWAALLLSTALFNALTQPIFVAILASRQTDIEHSGAGWNLAATSGLTPGALCRVKLAALTLLIVPATIAQSAVLIVVARSMGLSLPLDAGPWVVYTLLLALVDTAMCAYHLWLAAVVENQLVVMSAGLLGGFIGVYMLLAPPVLARLLPWGYYAVITPAKVSMVNGHDAYEYISVPAGWIAGFAALTAVVFTVVTRRLDRIER